MWNTDSTPGRSFKPKILRQNAQTGGLKQTKKTTSAKPFPFRATGRSDSRL